jgi:hypothetical protein
VAREIAAAIKMNSVVLDIDLIRNRIRGEGSRAIAEALNMNSVLRNINPILIDSIGDGARKILMC